MKIALVGATGFVGSAVLAEAVEPRSRRSPPSPATRKRSPLAGAGVNVASRRRAQRRRPRRQAAGHDVVIATYNPGWTNPNIRAEHLAGSQAIVNATRDAGVRAC